MKLARLEKGEKCIQILSQLYWGFPWGLTESWMYTNNYDTFDLAVSAQQSQRLSFMPRRIKHGIIFPKSQTELQRYTFNARDLHDDCTCGGCDVHGPGHLWAEWKSCFNAAQMSCFHLWWRKEKKTITNTHTFLPKLLTTVPVFNTFLI